MTYQTEDGATVATGDRVYNYYDMKPGVIGADSGCDGPFIGMADPNKKRWFKFAHDDGTGSLLNGERICTIAFAQRRGFPGV